MTDLTDIQFYMTSEHECSYITEEKSVSVFVDPKEEINKLTFSQLSEIGFRRSGKHIYRPHCTNCRACIAIRVPVQSFQPSRSQKRCLQKNSDLTSIVVDKIDTDEHFNLYEKYIRLRHSDGDMFPPTRNQFQEFLSSEFGVTEFLEFRDTQNTLIAVAVCDQLNNGLSAVYTFFDPEQEKRSLGVFGVLQEIKHTQSLGLPYLYLGYWIKQCNKMNYKTNYRPFQLYVNNQWTMFT